MFVHTSHWLRQDILIQLVVCISSSEFVATVSACVEALNCRIGIACKSLLQVRLFEVVLSRKQWMVKEKVVTPTTCTCKGVITQQQLLFD